MIPKDVRRLFEGAMSRPDDEIDLAEAALLVAQEQYPAAQEPIAFD